jgi:bifunctional N-acetylglucosamine-1-phosphate-uridyltransferase/glucosamine-1-phosphate-acetyltransferase GlmU-like protein
MITVILAGGLGKRMNSEIPKVLHLVHGKPMLYYSIQNALLVGSTHILIVVGAYKLQIQAEMNKYFGNHPEIQYVLQPDAQGTGDAVKCCLPYLSEILYDAAKEQREAWWCCCDCPTKSTITIQTPVLILSGDVPLLRQETLTHFVKTTRQNSILVTYIKQPYGCGRIQLSEETNQIVRIIEEKDCSPEERSIMLVNGGIYCISLETLLQVIPRITNQNAAHEFYLTDIVELARQDNLAIHPYVLPESQQREIININTTKELQMVNTNTYF